MGKGQYTMRMKRIIITMEALAGMFISHGEPKADSAIRWNESGIPDKDYKVAGIQIDPVTRLVYIYIEHPSFEEVQEGREVPQLEIRMRLINPKEIMREKIDELEEENARLHRGEDD